MEGNADKGTEIRPVTSEEKSPEGSATSPTNVGLAHTGRPGHASKQSKVQIPRAVENGIYQFTRYLPRCPSNIPIIKSHAIKEFAVLCS